MVLATANLRTSRRVLAITDDAHQADLIRESLHGGGSERFEVAWVRSLTDGIDALNRLSIAAVITGLALPDSRGIETMERLLTAAPQVPILVLGDPHDEETSKQAVQRGAQDFLPTSRLDSYSLPRAVQSVIALKSSSQALRSDGGRAEITLNSLGDAVLSTDLRGKVTYLNTMAESMTGWKRQEAYGRSLGDVFKVIDRATRETSGNPLEFALQQDHVVALPKDTLLVRRDGVESAVEDSAAPIRDRAGCVVGAVIVFRSVGQAQALAQRMAHLALHDVLTDLPNRKMLTDRLAQAIRMAERRPHKVAVLFIDVDKLKAVNDSMGHLIGDALLQSIGRRLRQTLRNADTVSRHGGDEFIVLLPEVATPTDAGLVAKKILLALTPPHSVAGHTLQVTASIGISIFPEDGADAEALIHCADMAMYQAKSSGGCVHCFFTQKPT